MLDAHRRNLLKKSAICAILLNRSSPVGSGKAISNIVFLTKSKISIVFDNFFLWCHFACSARGVKAILFTTLGV